MDDELRTAVEQFQYAIETRDVSMAAEVLDEGYALMFVQPTPATMHRTRWLEVLPEYLVHSYRIAEQTLDVDGDVAVVLQRVEMSATALGQDRSGTFVISDVWRLRGDGWNVATSLDAASSQQHAWRLGRGKSGVDPISRTPRFCGPGLGRSGSCSVLPLVAGG